MRKLTCLAASLIACALAAEPAAAQFGGNSGQQGGGRSSTSGAGGTSGMFGNTQRGGVSNRQQSSFARGTSGNTGGTAGQGNPLANLGGADAMLSNRAQQSNGFIGRSSEDMQRFIGAAAAQQGQGQNGGRMQGTNFGGGRNQQFGGQMGRGQQGMQGMNGQFGEMFDNQSAEQLQNQRRFRTKLSLGFAPTPKLATTFASASSIRLTRSLERSVGTGVQVQLADATVVLTGTVPTSTEKMLAEQLALLEPGVGRVQNDLVVAGETPTAN
jgi:osmotically-inducible protein OsmY